MMQSIDESIDVIKRFIVQKFQIQSQNQRQRTMKSVPLVLNSLPLIGAFICEYNLNNYDYDMKNIERLQIAICNKPRKF